MSLKTIEGSPVLRTIASKPPGAGESIFIERSALIFDHVLSLLQDDEYEYPLEYIRELKYYQIEIPLSIKKRFIKVGVEKLKLDYCFMMMKMDRNYCINGACINEAGRGLKWCSECGEVVPSTNQKLRTGVLAKFTGSNAPTVYMLIKHLNNKGNSLAAYRLLDWEETTPKHKGCWSNRVIVIDAPITIVKERLKTKPTPKS